MIQEDDAHNELPPHTESQPLAPTPGVKVYDRPNRTLPPAWVLILLALLVLAGLWLVFTYVFS